VQPRRRSSGGSGAGIGCHFMGLVLFSEDASAARASSRDVGVQLALGFDFSIIIIVIINMIYIAALPRPLGSDSFNPHRVVRSVYRVSYRVSLQTEPDTFEFLPHTHANCRRTAFVLLPLIYV